MKLIHVADIHLDSAFSSIEGNEAPETRRLNLSRLFNKLVGYARKNNVKVILLSGDIFDTCNVRNEQLRNFVDIIRKHNDIDFLYLRGNHDISVDLSQYNLPNLKTFTSDEWTTYRYDNVVVSGKEMTERNYESIYNGLNLNKEDVNIVMIHGDIKKICAKDTVNLSKLLNKNIDYLALGHIHKRDEGKIDNRGVYVNPGCLQGRAFDETGEKGFYILDVAANKIGYKFIHFSEFEYVIESVDISDCNSDLGVINKIKKVLTKRNNRYRIILTGKYKKSGLNWANTIESELSDSVSYINIIEETSTPFDINKILKENTFRSAFVKKVLGRDDLSNEVKNQIIDIGLSSLSEDNK